MKRTSIIALPIALLLVAGCSGNDGDKPDASASEGGDSSSAAPAPNTPVPATPGGTPVNADQGSVKFTSCKTGKGGVAMEAEVTNTTKEKRTYIVTGMVFGADKKPASSAAIMIDAIEPGKTVKGTGTTNKPVDGDITCEATQIDSMVIQ